MSQFEQLLAELNTTAEEQETLAKSLQGKDGKDDKNIQAAAENDPDEKENEEEENDEGNGRDGEMAKSITAMIDGAEVEAIDATEIIKSLDSRLTVSEEVLAKGLQGALGIIKSQGEMIKSLNARLDTLAKTGTGRKAVVSIHQPPSTMAKSQDASAKGMTPQEFLAKANAAFTAGKITGKELTMADVAIRSGVEIPSEIITKALA
jgi:hypothetical protein